MSALLYDIPVRRLSTRCMVTEDNISNGGWLVSYHCMSRRQLGEDSREIMGNKLASFGNDNEVDGKGWGKVGRY